MRQLHRFRSKDVHLPFRVSGGLPELGQVLQQVRRLRCRDVVNRERATLEERWLRTVGMAARRLRDASAARPNDTGIVYEPRGW